jgi:hypothetical protein
MIAVFTAAARAIVSSVQIAARRMKRNVSALLIRGRYTAT